MGPFLINKRRPCPKKVGSAAEAWRPRLQGSSRSKRDFLRGSGDCLHCVPATPRRNCLAVRRTPILLRKTAILLLRPQRGNNIENDALALVRKRLLATASRKRARLQASRRAERDLFRGGAAGRTPQPHFAQKKCGEVQGLAATWCRWPDSNRHGIATGGF